MIGKIKKFIFYLEEKYLQFSIHRGEMKNIKRKKKFVDSVSLDNSQIEEINKLFLKNYGKKYSTKWHRLYQSYTNKFDKNYFPEILYSTKLERKLNNRNISKVYEDKALVELLYNGVSNLHFPKTFVLNSRGIWYDGNRQVISIERVQEILKDCKETIWKATVDSSSGKSITVCNIKNSKDVNSNMTVSELLSKYKSNFIVQEQIYNCDEIAKIYSKSLNTLRVTTYIANNKIHHVPIVMRIGTNDKQVDNVHAGGIFVAIEDDGKLHDIAFTEYQEKYKCHPNTKLKFKGYVIPNISEIIKIAYLCHARTPGMGIISWDFAIGKNNKIYLIENNITSQGLWLSQMAHGKSLFGENTEYMLQKIKEK